MQLIITGTSNGIGKALAELALAKQHKVFGIARRNEIEHQNYTHCTIDLSMVEQIKSFQFPDVDDSKIVLINNAGTLGEINYLGTLDETMLVDAITTNVIAPMLLLNKFIKKYSSQKGSKLLILNISSGAGNHPYDGWSEYCCSKAAIEMLTKVADKEIHEKKLSNCRVLSVYPGIVETNMQKKIRSTSSNSFSMLDKFVENFNNNVNKTPAESASEIYRVIENEKTFKGLVVDFWQL